MIFDDDEQNKAISIARSGKSLFLTGGAGVGKSTCLRKIVDELYDLHGENNVFVCASTGLAGCNLGIRNVWTINSFSGIKLGNGSKEELATFVRTVSICNHLNHHFSY